MRLQLSGVVGRDDVRARVERIAVINNATYCSGFVGRDWDAQVSGARLED